MKLVDDLRVFVERLAEVESSQVVLLHVEVNDAQVVVVHGRHVLARLVRRSVRLRCRVQQLNCFASVATQQLHVRLQIDHSNALQQIYHSCVCLKIII